MELTQEEIDQLYESNEFTQTTPVKDVISKAKNCYVNNRKEYTYNILKRCTFHEGQLFIDKLKDLWYKCSIKSMIQKVHCIISWIELYVCLNIRCTVIFRGVL